MIMYYFNNIKCKKNISYCQNNCYLFIIVVFGYFNKHLVNFTPHMQSSNFSIQPGIYCYYFYPGDTII